uniref:C-type lectin domain-containing protein n=1 Tax=Ascaris lumbricoides TaxID=6252 RepID=A0A9J2Q5B2_ASCLU
MGTVGVRGNHFGSERPSPMFSTVAVVVCIAFVECQAGWLQGARPQQGNMPCYLVVPGRVPLEQARGFCTLLTGTLGWPNTMDEMLMVNARANSLGVRTYWLGLEKRGGRWVWQNNAPPTFTNWRGREPDGCCGGNVSCAIVGYRRLSGAFWDDTSCNRLPPGLDGFFCRTN